MQALLDRLWREYAALNPQAARLHTLLSARGETVVNDHIAFRTFDHPSLGIGSFSQPFLRAGYFAGGAYEFPNQGLRAVHLQHSDPSLPKIFISELRLEFLPGGLQSLVLGLVNQVPVSLLLDPAFCASGRPWNLLHAEYEALGRKSEYAAWLAAFGFRANHFTVGVNGLKTFASLRELTRFIAAEGFALNRDGGEIKGNPEVYLEQASTLAAPARVVFRDGEWELPGCYYEFALRYRLPSGEMFQGFVAGNAARIFTSTDRRAKV